MIEAKIIKKGIYKHYKYYITLVICPSHFWYCAYVEIPILHPFYKTDYIELNLNVHGGLTYSGKSNRFDAKSNWYIGWDYNHYGDYNGSVWCDENDFHWNPGLIESECIDVIDQLISVDKSLIKVF